MAYMGDTPKFENIRWKNTGATAPSSPEAGQFYYNTGTGTDAEGFWIYASADGTSTGTKAWRHISPTNNASNFTTGMLGSAYGGVPVGTVLPYTREDSTDALPTGYFLCDGASISQSTYSALYAVIGTSAGDGTTGPGSAGTGNFNIPDYRGFFMRAREYSASGRDPGIASRTALITGGATGINNNTYQTDAFQDHRHNLTLNGYEQDYGQGPGGWSSEPHLHHSNMTKVDDDGGYTSSTVGGTARKEAETRPKNLYVEYIIKHS